MKSKHILDTADLTADVTPDFLAIAADRVSKRAAINQSDAQAIMVAGFASDGVATRAWSFVITDKDGVVDTFVECTGIDEFGNDAWYGSATAMALSLRPHNRHIRGLFKKHFSTCPTATLLSGLR